VSENGPIGVLDSGVGGLSVLREIRRDLPTEDLLYAADSRHAPYGERTAAFIEARSVAIVEFFASVQAKAVVVACNTATSVAIDALRSRFSIPIVAIEPALKPAAAATRSGTVAVLATSRTLESDKFAQLLSRYGTGINVLIQPCPGLVEQVEKGDLFSRDTRLLVERYVLPLLEKGADILVLGCTHYPFLDPLIRAVTGPSVSIIDPAEAVARELRRRLQQRGLLSSRDRPGTERFWTSGAPETVKRVVDRLWVTRVDVQPLPSEARR